MSLTFNHTVTTVGLRATAWSASSVKACSTVAPGIPRFTKTVRRGNAVRYKICGQAWRSGSSVPTPTDSLAPTATYVTGGPWSSADTAGADGRPDAEHPPII